MSGIIHEMGTTRRHNHILSDIWRDITSKLFDLYKQKKIMPVQEQLALCYYGNYNEIDIVKLIDANEFTSDEINYVNVIYPDFMLFHNNKYLINKEETRYAGKPDLIVEVWSKGNDDYHRRFKTALYSTSDITEHWYIEQHSNDILCMIGKTILPPQNLQQILITQNGLTLDLRHLAL